MSEFSVYDADGVILRTGNCQECDVDLQAGEGEFVFRGFADPEKHRIIDGQLVEFDSTVSIDIQREVRLDRNTLLSKSDWTQMPDSPLTDEQKLAWAEYRQKLRDITSNLDGITELSDVPWPTLQE